MISQRISRINNKQRIFVVYHLYSAVVAVLTCTIIITIPNNVYRNRFSYDNNKETSN